LRTRLVIPAALLVAAAYVKGRQDAHLLAPATPEADPAPSPDTLLRAQAEAADAWEMGLAEAEAAAALAEAPVVEEEEALVVVDEPVVENDPVDEDEPAAEAPAPAPIWIPDFETALVAEAAPSVFTPRGPAWEPDPAALSEWLAHPAGAAPRIEASGRFTLGGWASQAGHMALAGVTFPSRLAEAVAAGRLRLIPDVMQNVAGAGVTVLADPGFAPDAEGFTLLVAAAGPGAFAATGRWELIAGTSR
jgi:hypothetical protein